MFITFVQINRRKYKKRCVIYNTYNLPHLASPIKYTPWSKKIPLVIFYPDWDSIKTSKVPPYCNEDANKKYLN